MEFKEIGDFLFLSIRDHLLLRTFRPDEDFGTTKSFVPSKHLTLIIQSTATDIHIRGKSNIRIISYTTNHTDSHAA